VYWRWLGFSRGVPFLLRRLSESYTKVSLKVHEPRSDLCRHLGVAGLGPLSRSSSLGSKEIIAGTPRSRGCAVYTSDYVLDEVTTLLFRREVFSEAVRLMEGLFAAASVGSLTVERVTSARFVPAWERRKRFQDKPRVSFTDLTSMVTCRNLGSLRC